ncbi:MAG: LamG domain-containing protein, partial [Catalinimonas sp.]
MRQYPLLTALLCGLLLVCPHPAEAQRSVAAAEYFIGAVDPGEGAATPLAAADGAFDEALEAALATSGVFATAGPQRINVRFRGSDGVWGAIFATVITVDEELSPPRNVSITQAEYFWGTADPGEGGGTAMLAFDGDFNEALETAFVSGGNPPGVGIRRLNIRMRDAAGRWGDIFSVVVNVDEELSPPRNVSITAGEVFWNADPGEGGGTPLVAFDNNFDGAVEQAGKTLGTTGLSAGPNKLSVRFRDEEGWGAPFSMVVFVEGCTTTPQVAIAEGGPTTFCDGGSVLLSANRTFDAYVWRNAFGDTVSTEATFTATVSGRYTLTVDSLGCSGTSTASDVFVELRPVNTDPADTVVINASGLTAYYPLDGDAQSAGGTYTADGTVAGGVQPTDNYEGEAGRALDFDGATGEINFGDVTALNGTRGFTIAGWFKQDALNVRGGMFAKILNSSNMIRARTWSDGFLYVYVYNGGVSWGRFDYSQFVRAGEWFHFAMRYDGTAANNAGRLKVYVNGAEVGLGYSGTLPPNVPNLVGTDFVLSEDVNVATKGENWSGGIDQFRIYKTALALTDIQKLAFESRNPVLLTPEAVCAGDAGTVEIYPSQPGIRYQLRDADDQEIGGALLGNGDTLRFATGPVATTAPFTFRAFNAVTTACGEE